MHNGSCCLLGCRKERLMLKLLPARCVVALFLAHAYDIQSYPFAAQTDATPAAAAEPAAVAADKPSEAPAAAAAAAPAESAAAATPAVAAAADAAPPAGKNARILIRCSMSF